MSATWEIRQGDALDRLREMPDESIHCCITSPPYYGLRDYGVEGQIGLEASPDEFVAKLVEVFAEVKRVLRSDGTLWLNLGDSYGGSWGAQSRGASDDSSTLSGSALSGRQIKAHPRSSKTGSIPGGSAVKAKDLLGIPWTVAFALRADGWYLRRDIIWAKPNPMPESVTDRPTSAHEYIFLLTKSARYYYDAESIREPASYAGPNGAQQSPHAQGFGRRTAEQERERQDKQRGHSRRHAGFNERWDQMSHAEQAALGRNKRSVWEVATRPYPEAHFATFPEALVRPMILAGAAPQTCGECGAPWHRLVEVSANPGGISGQPGKAYSKGTRNTTIGDREKVSGRHVYREARTVGWEPTCDHAAGRGLAVVLDPFAGSGTTLQVAVERGRTAIGIELNREYVALAEDRLAGVTAPLFSEEAA